jgi:hypothetical protein
VGCDQRRRRDRDADQADDREDEKGEPFHS